MYFTITTSRKTAEGIKKQCEYEKNLGNNRSYDLGEIIHGDGYSKVQIKSKGKNKIEPSDIFFLGLFTGLSDKN